MSFPPLSLDESENSLISPLLHFESSETFESSVNLETNVEKDIILVCNDGGKINVEKSIVVISDFINTILGNDKKCREIPIPLSSGIVKIIIEYMIKKKGNKDIVVNKPPLYKNTMTLCCSKEGKWEAEFIDSLSKNNLIDIMHASNYLSIDSLVHLGCAKMSLNLKGKSEAQMEVEMRKD